MPSPRIHCDVRLGPGAQFSLAPEAAQHVSKALRLKVGDGLTVFDGRGGEFEAVIQRIDRERVDVKVGAGRDVERESALAIGLVQGLPEADKMDWIIQKAVELGVGGSSRSSAIAASCGCRARAPRGARRTGGAWRSRRASRAGATAFPRCARRWASRAGSPHRRRSRAGCCCPARRALAAHEPPRAPFELLVGPEGGLSDRERDLALGRGCEPLALGPRVLRAETAPIAALAAIHALWGDFSGAAPR